MTPIRHRFIEALLSCTIYNQDNQSSQGGVYQRDVVKFVCEVLHSGSDRIEDFNKPLQVLLPRVTILLQGLQLLLMVFQHLLVTKNSRRKCRGLRIPTTATPTLSCSGATFSPGEFSFSRVLHVLELFVQELLLLFQLLQQLLVLFFQLHQMLVCLLLRGEALYYLLQMNK